MLKFVKFQNKELLCRHHYTLIDDRQMAYVDRRNETQNRCSLVSSVCLQVTFYPSVYLSIYLSIYLFIYIWVCHDYGQMGHFKVYTTFNKSLGQTAPSA